MKQTFQPEWRTQSRAKRRFYAKYMSWIEKGGYAVVLCVFAAFIFAFNFPVDDLIKADSVPIEAEAVLISSESDAMILSVQVEDFAEVKKGQPLMVIVEGEDEIAQYKQAQASSLLREAGKSLSFKIQMPKGRTILAPSDGTFKRLSEEELIKAGDPIAKVMNYSVLVMKPELEGNTVAKAKVDQAAKISAINFGSDSGVLFRGSSNDGDLFSSSLVGKEVKEDIEKELKGLSVKVRDDIPLVVDGIKQIQADSALQIGPASSVSATRQADPPTYFSLKGTVLEGTPSGTLQIAGLPNDLATKTTSILENAAKETDYLTAQGKRHSVQGLSDTKFVVQLNVKGEADASTQPLPATMINRKFVAKVRVTDPPQFLIDAVKQADRSGKVVTARVEVITGTRPIALILLKKS